MGDGHTPHMQGIWVKTTLCLLSCNEGTKEILAFCAGLVTAISPVLTSAGDRATPSKARESEQNLGIQRDARVYEGVET